MEKLTEATWDTVGIPFGWTIISLLLVYAIGLPIYTTDTTNGGVHIAFAVLFGVWATFLTVLMLVYLFRNILVQTHPLRTPLGALFGLLDFWFSLITMQTAVLYIPYMFNPVGAFTGGGVLNGPWYAWLQLSLTVVSNFHGAVAGDIVPISVFPLIWLTLSSILARLFMVFAIPIILRIIYTVLTTQQTKKRGYYV